MRVVVERKMTIGHVMYYPGEVAEVPDEVKVEELKVEGDPSPSAQDEGIPVSGKRRRGRKP